MILKLDFPGKVSTDTSSALKFESLANAGAPYTGWFSLPSNLEYLKQSKIWSAKIPKSVDTLVVLGIGGSCLGAKAIYDFLKPSKKVVFLDNIDGHSFEKSLNQLNFKKTHFVAISKSGETSETLFQVFHVLDLLKAKKLLPRKFISIITEDKSSTLRKLGQTLSLDFLPVPVDVGGRFSVLCNVGLGPLTWAGINMKEVLSGAAWAKTQVEMVSQLANWYLDSFRRKEPISIFWIYVDGLRSFGLWLEQLWAESLAKAKDRNGTPGPFVTTPKSCIGATDQHSLLQQFTEGSKDKNFLFFRSGVSEKSKKIKNPFKLEFPLANGKSVGELLGIEADATTKILRDLGIHIATLKLNGHGARDVGALIFFFEFLIGTLGESLNINAFDQPGVEAVKKVTLGTLGDARYSQNAL